MATLEDITRGAAVKGILPDGLVTISDVRWIGTVAIEVTYADSGPKFLAVNGNPIIAFEMDELDSRRISNVRKLD